MSMDLVTLIGRNHCAGPFGSSGNTVGLGVDQTLTHLLYRALKCEKLFCFFRENKHFFDEKKVELKATPPWMSIDLVTDIH